MFVDNRKYQTKCKSRLDNRPEDGNTYSKKRNQKGIKNITKAKTYSVNPKHSCFLWVRRVLYLSLDK